ncbi:Hpt domain-containing protein [Dyadobacter aurulentus]|uniref:Hpt domain-containing protein n=1 Tax=Dyadobacter sp. UC 10 TaxID=2605428 RepID=UPI0011F2EA5E|nr:Hpt domain-containing protein [Dyadobacter sp. UC 10]KAA0993785.1 Hpt domain-containing protein [Dyadobacter sp. UC 10]
MSTTPPDSTFGMDNSAAEDSLIDIAYLNEITGGDAELRTELIDMFESETVIQLAGIKTHFVSSEVEQLKQAIHKYRSSLFSVGLLKTASKYKEIETALKRNETVENLGTKLLNLEQESMDALQLLKNF